MQERGPTGVHDNVQHRLVVWRLPSQSPSKPTDSWTCTVVASKPLSARLSLAPAACQLATAMFCHGGLPSEHASQESPGPPSEHFSASSRCHTSQLGMRWPKRGNALSRHPDMVSVCAPRPVACAPHPANGVWKKPATVCLSPPDASSVRG